MLEGSEHAPVVTEADLRPRNEQLITANPDLESSRLVHDYYSDFLVLEGVSVDVLATFFKVAVVTAALDSVRLVGVDYCVDEADPVLVGDVEVR